MWSRVGDQILWHGNHDESRTTQSIESAVRPSTTMASHSMWWQARDTYVDGPAHRPRSMEGAAWEVQVGQIERLVLVVHHIGRHLATQKAPHARYLTVVLLCAYAASQASIHDTIESFATQHIGTEHMQARPERSRSAAGRGPDGATRPRGPSADRDRHRHPSTSPWRGLCSPKHNNL